jgi:MFS family permease
MTAWLTLLRLRPAFRWLWLAECISLVGDWVSYVAVTALAADREGSGGAVAIAAVLIAHNLPHVVLAGWAGVLADRFDRRRMLIAIHVGQLVVTLAMAAAAAIPSIALVSALVVVRAAVGALDAPARAGALRRSVEEHELLDANALTGATWSAMFAVGMGLGGLAAAFGTVGALLIDASTFGVATALIALLPAMPTAGASAAPPKLWDAAKWAWDRRPVRLAIGSKAPLAVAGGAGLVTLALSSDAFPYLWTAALTYGVIQAVKGIGTGIGPVVATSAVRRGLPPRAATVIVSWLAFASIAAYGLVGGGPLGLLASFGWGLGTGTNWVLSTASLQELAPDEQIGRLSALDWVLLTIGSCAGAASAAVVITATGDPRSGALFGASAGAFAWVGLAAISR